MKILVIDDNLNITKLLERFLKLKEHECVTSNDAQKGLLLLNEQKFDATILDLAMPRFTGIDFLKSIRKDKVNQDRIIVLTASNITVNEERDILDMGASVVLRKPVDLDVLLNSLCG